MVSERIKLAYDPYAVIALLASVTSPRRGFMPCHLIAPGPPSRSSWRRGFSSLGVVAGRCFDCPLRNLYPHLLRDLDPSGTRLYLSPVSAILENAPNSTITPHW